MRAWFLLLWMVGCSTGAAPAGDDEGGADAGRPPDAAPDAAPAEPDAEEPAQTVGQCFEGVFAGELPVGPDYDQFGPAVAGHCRGTDHQDITGIERVVFLGDSVTVGTPPTSAGKYYRSRLADRLAQRFDLQAPNGLWEQSDPLEGTALLQSSGDFASCARWGARTDDLLRDNDQILDCFPPAERHKRTLVVMTVGGNDVAKLTQRGIDGVPLAQLWDEAVEFVDLLRDAVGWFYEDPDRFPNGVFVVFANMFEFTDGTGDLSACDGAELAGYGADWEDPDALADLVIWVNEQFLKIAVDTGTDMIFMLESFCGHGFHHDNPSAPCYRGPGTPRWFDATCIHPNAAGHEAIADMFMAVVDE